MIKENRNTERERERAYLRGNEKRDTLSDGDCVKNRRERAECERNGNANVFTLVRNAAPNKHKREWREGFIVYICTWSRVVY